MSSTVTTIAKLRRRALDALEPARPAALLLARIGVGLVFLSTGWGKIHDLDKVAHFFETLGIPAPGFQAAFVGYTELLCGAALVVGLLSRLATIPLIVSMVVAILTAKKDSLHGLFDLVGFDEFTYIVVLVMILVLGPGAWSADHAIAKRLEAEAERG
ncbi:MAG TPA: DoxX family protein [Minicystis sp.]|nr:DoxX family protein [Minicystis sp.]